MTSEKGPANEAEDDGDSHLKDLAGSPNSESAAADEAQDLILHFNSSGTL